MSLIILTKLSKEKYDKLMIGIMVIDAINIKVGKENRLIYATNYSVKRREDYMKVLNEVLND